MNKKFFRDLVPLVAICLVAALLLAIFNLITEGPIAENALRAAQETRTRLLSAAATFEQMELEEGSAMDSCYEGFNADGESVGYVVETTVGGYGGEIVVTVGLDADNVITGINVGGENFSETAGLGALAKEASFTDQFIGETVPLSLQKGESGLQDGIIDAISGATITSTAVNGGVNSAGKFVMDLSGGGASPNTASVQGFAGPVAVTLSLDDAGAITEITIGDAFFNETPGYGAGALEEAFQAQFIGKVPPLALADIDAIAGATITSTAVVDAINQVQAQLSGAAPVSAPAEEIAPVPAAGENAKTASAQGFAGPVAVAVDLDENNTITAITIGDDSFAETAGFGAKALDDAFKAQFIGKTLPLAMADIDAIAGATITSNAVVEALNAAAGFTAEEPAEEAASVPAASESAKTASAQGFAGPVAVAVDLDESTAITAITIGDDSFAETAGFGAKALEDAFKAQFIGKTLPMTAADIDGIAGATITTNAVVDALNSIVDSTDMSAEDAVPAVAVVEAEGEVFTGSTQGFAGPVAVEVTISEGVITGIKIGDDQFAETPGFGAKALEEDFQKQFIGKSLPVSVEDIDAIAGATITTNAVIEAINNAEQIADVATAEAISGTVYTASAEGFAGPVAVEVTVDNDQITAIVIGDNQFAETPGFGALALEDDFQKQFIGKSLPVKAEDIDAIAGATITTNAVIDAINSAFGGTSEEIPADTATSATADTTASATAAVETEGEETVLVGSAQGFNGPVVVEVTVDANNTITAITIGDETFVETLGFGTNVQRESYTSKFIGRVIPLQDGDIDAVTGATITSNAVVEAVNAAQAVVAEETVSGKVLTASAQGFAGPVAVEVTVDSDNVITAIKIGDEQFAETTGFGANAQEEAFLNQFIGKSLPVESFDAIAGATVTSDAITEAFKTINSSISQEAAVESSETVLTASAQGFAGPVAVEVTVDSNNVITAIKIGDEQFAETPGFGANAQEEAFLNQFIGKTLPVAAEDIDAIAGATITTNAVIEALSLAAAE